MTISVNANRSALNALQTLARGADPAAAQTRTGAAAKPGSDKSASAAVASGGLRAEVVSLAQMKRGLDRAASISDVALSAGQSVSDILEQLREQAADGEGSRSVAARLQGALRQIEQVVQKASFDGVNLLDGSLDEDLRISLDGRSEVTLSPRDLRPGGAFVTLADGAEEGDMLARLRSSTVNVSSALADLRIQSRQIESHGRFVSRLGEALVSEQADGDLSKDSARLHALQIQQQLAGQQLSIVNQAPQLVLHLFRG
ncbi:MAG TPA: flagellin [Caulobacteraceae bacterium]|jgi:flagellin